MSDLSRPWWADGARILEPILAPLPKAPYVLEAEGGRMDSNPAVAMALAIPAALDDLRCEEVLALASVQPRARGRDLDKAYGRRECVCAWIPDGGVSRWLYRRVADVFVEANEAFGFRLTGLMEPLLAIAYDEGDFFDWHLDTGPELAANRKLSLSILLNDAASYEGGQLEFAGQVEPVSQGKGSACVFPSFLAHRVTPVTRGRRIALVAFAYGPTFT